MRKDSELVVLPALGGCLCGAAATFKNLCLSREDLPGGIQLGKSRVPATRTKDPIAKGDPTGINFPLCVEPVDAAKDHEQLRPGLHAAHACMGIIDVTKPPLQRRQYRLERRQRHPDARPAREQQFRLGQ